MPRYASSNPAAVDPDYRKANNIGTGGGGDPKKRRYAYGQKNNVLVAAGSELFGQGFTIRMLPIYEEGARDDNGNRVFANFREGRNNAAFGDWGRLYTCANWVGNPGICFVIHDGNSQSNPYDSPYHVLRNIAWNHKETPGIGRLFSELLSVNFVPKSHVGSLRKPEQTLFISASAVSLDNNGQPVLWAFTDDKDKNARIIGLKTSANAAFNAAMSVRDEATGEYMAGDMLSFGPAKLITFLTDSYSAGPNVRNSNAISPQGPTGVQTPKYTQQTTPVIVGYPPKRSSMTHFCVVHDGYNGKQVSLEPYAERIVNETLSWDEYMFLPSYEEQAEMLVPAFPKEALQFAWQEWPEYLRVLPRGTTTVEVGDRDVEELEVNEQPAQQAYSAGPAVQQQRLQTPPTALPAAELSSDEEAAVDNMFAAAPGPAPAARPATNVADIVARARAAAAKNR
jgi:hypothetical protein